MEDNGHILYYILLWLIWKDRCSRIFEGTGSTSSQIIRRAMALTKERTQKNPLIKAIANKSVGAIVDGAFLNRDTIAGIGIIVFQGRTILHAVSQPVRTTSALMTEAKAIASAIYIKESQHIPDLIIFTDSKASVDILHHEVKGPPEIEEIFKQLWESNLEGSVTFCHRPYTTGADWLAKEAIRTGHSMWWDTNFPPGLSSFFYFGM